MAHDDQGTSPRLQRLTAFGAVALLAAATAVAFGRVFAGRAPTLKLLAAALASAVVAALLERRNLMLATVVSAAAMVLVVGLLVFPSTTWHGLPTGATLQAMLKATGSVGYQARVEVAPTPPLRPLLLAGVTAIWAAIFSAHALASRAGSPLLALLPPVALLTFADTVLEDAFRPHYGLLFLAGALAVVFVDGLRRVQRWGPVWSWPRGRRRLAASRATGARQVAALALLVAGLAPAFLPGFSTTAVLDFGGGANNDRVRIDPQVSIAAALRRTDPVPVFTVRSNHASYWRMLALDVFDGTSWHARPGDAQIPVGPGTTLFPQAPGQPAISQSFTITADDVGVPGVPVAYPPTHIVAPDQHLTYDRELSTLSLDGDLTLARGATYSVSSNLVQPTAEELNAEHDFGTPAQYARWTQLPTDPTIDGIRGLAEQWTRGADTVFQRVIAIQRRLTDPSQFTYDQAVPARDDSFTLLDFLTNTHAGFCQQFASAMAVMLRTLGIPARVAVGFTTAQSVAAGRGSDLATYAVTTDQAHSWVEVYFPKYGWLPFEPTPGRTNPIGVAYYSPSAVQCALEGGAACQQDQGTGTVTTGTTTGPEGNLPGQLRKLIATETVQQRFGGHGRGGSSLPASQSARRTLTYARVALLVLLGLGLFAAVVVPPARALGRRRRLRRARREARPLILATYEVFADRAADLGLGRGPGETLLEYRVRLASSGLVDDGDLDVLTALAARAAYATGDPSPQDVLAAATAADAAIRDLRKKTPLARRIVGLYGLDR